VTPAVGSGQADPGGDEEDCVGDEEDRVSDDRAELATMGTTLDELVTRATAMAERYRGGPRDDLAIRLFELERSLVRANRQLAALMRQI
jgi:hypothetical protein